MDPKNSMPEAVVTVSGQDFRLYAGRPEYDYSWTKQEYYDEHTAALNRGDIFVWQSGGYLYAWRRGRSIGSWRGWAVEDCGIYDSFVQTLITEAIEKNGLYSTAKARRSARG